ncbi:MAG: HAD family hydrolase [Candidatus Heimdallarchaeota archaeon]
MIYQVDELKAVIFDLDGTLVKTSLDFWGMKEAVIEYLVNLGLNNSSLNTTQTTNELIQKGIAFLKTKGASKTEIRGILTEISEIMNQFELDGVEHTVVIRDAQNVLNRLKHQGFKIGVLTRSCEAYAIKALELCKIREFVEVIGVRTDPRKAKPNPEAALQVCASLGVEPHEAILIGDHPMDLKCAKDAGMDFIGILGGASSEETLKKAGTVHIAKNLTDVEKMLDSTASD